MSGWASLQKSVAMAAKIWAGHKDLGVSAWSTGNVLRAWGCMSHGAGKREEARALGLSGADR